MKKELTANEIVIKEMINANQKNDPLDNIYKEVSDLKQSLEFMQDQIFIDNIDNIKKELKKLDKNIKEVEDDLLDPHCLIKTYWVRGSLMQK